MCVCLVCVTYRSVVTHVEYFCDSSSSLVVEAIYVTSCYHLVTSSPSFSFSFKVARLPQHPLVAKVDSGQHSSPKKYLETLA